MTAKAQNASRRYVVGIDSSTQSTKAIAWDAEGRVAAEGRASVALSQPQPGYAEQDCENWWRALSSTLQKVVSVVGADTIDAVSISNQRETVAFLDASGRAVRPAMVWLDERAITTYADYADSMGREWLHRTTGKPIDTIPVVYRLDWLRRNEPAVLDACARGDGCARLLDRPPDRGGRIDMVERRSVRHLRHQHDGLVAPDPRQCRRAPRPIAGPCQAGQPNRQGEGRQRDRSGSRHTGVRRWG